MLHDLLTSFRRAVRAPLFSLALVGILGVGIGATTTMVSVLDTLLWRPVAVPHPNELVAITPVLPDGARRGLPLASAERVMRAALPVDVWCAYSGGGSLATQIDSRLIPAGGALMSAGCVDVMRVAPVMGRWFTETEAPVSGRGHALAVISDRYWKRMSSTSSSCSVRFGSIGATGDQAALGRHLTARTRSSTRSIRTSTAIRAGPAAR
jgi:hypothetical protein